MPVLIQDGKEKSVNKTVFRDTTCCLKLTKAEALMVDEVAKAKGVPRSEWMRDAILNQLQLVSATDPALSEILGVRLLLVNVLRPLAAGQRVPPETFDKLLDQISVIKHEMAGEIVAKTRR